MYIDSSYRLPRRSYVFGKVGIGVKEGYNIYSNPYWEGMLGVGKLFRYDLSKVGRYKFNKKLNVIDRLLDQVLAEDIIVDGNVVFEKGTKITKANIKELNETLKDLVWNFECSILGNSLKVYIVKS